MIRLNIAAPGWEKTFGPLRDAFNAEHGWARPDDPARARVQQPGHRAYIEATRLRAGLRLESSPRDLIRDYLLQRVEHGTGRELAARREERAAVPSSAIRQRRELLLKAWLRPLIVGLGLWLGIFGGGWATMHWLSRSIQDRIETLAEVNLRIERARETLAEMEETTWGVADAIRAPLPRRPPPTSPLVPPIANGRPQARSISSCLLCTGARSAVFADVIRPPLHQVPPALEQVAPGVGALRLVTD